MTRDEIMRLTGRDLDAHVGVLLFNWPAHLRDICPPWSDYAHMGFVLARLRDLHPNWRSVIEPPWEDATTSQHPGEVSVWTARGRIARVPFASVSDLPAAVCRAALLALEGQP